MPNRTYHSRVLTKAEPRLAGLLAIDARIDLCGGLTAKALRDSTALLASQVASYNQAIAEAAAIRSDIARQERQVSDLFVRALAAVGGKFGPDSREYRQAGGTPRSARKRHHRKAATATNGAAENGGAPPSTNGHAGG